MKGTTTMTTTTHRHRGVFFHAEVTPATLDSEYTEVDTCRCGAERRVRVCGERRVRGRWRGSWIASAMPAVAEAHGGATSAHLTNDDGDDVTVVVKASGALMVFNAPSPVCLPAIARASGLLPAARRASRAQALRAD
jgi:hypothetical protein